MTYAYDTDTKEFNGRKFKVAYYYDEDMGAPWQEHDGHGVISGWERRDKTPGERILAEDKRFKLFYDVQTTMKKAKAEGWATQDTLTKSRGERAAAAVEADFKRMQAWINNDWHWTIVKVTLLDEDGEETQHSASLGGVESDYVKSVLNSLCEECVCYAEAATYPVTECGI